MADSKLNAGFSRGMLEIAGLLVQLAVMCSMLFRAGSCEHCPLQEYTRATQNFDNRSINLNKKTLYRRETGAG